MTLQDRFNKAFKEIYAEEKCGWPTCPCDPFEGYVECDGRGGPRILPHLRRNAPAPAEPPKAP